MIRVALATLACAVVSLAQSPAPGFTMTIDGDGFSNARFTAKPFVANYTNNYWSSKRDPRINRITLQSNADTGPEIRFDVPITSGVYIWDRADEDREDRNTYLGFVILITNPKDESQNKMYRPEHVAVTITRFDPPGGRIEGTLKGTLYRSVARDMFHATVNGTFSVVRQKDRVVD